MVFYFSGTGNSQLAAKQIADELGDNLTSINQCLKKGERSDFCSLQPLVFVAPIYAWRVPEVVEKWICKTKFAGNSRTYFILTRGGSTGGNAAAYAKKLCAKAGLGYQGLASVHMPENYIALSKAPSEKECESIIAQARPVFSELARQIKEDRLFSEEPVSIGGRLLSGPVHELYYRFFIKDKGFTVSDACVSCGKCAKRCPLNNIDIIDGKPLWKGNCTHCMACICSCPVEAIEYKSISKGKRRYDIMEE